MKQYLIIAFVFVGSFQLQAQTTAPEYNFPANKIYPFGLMAQGANGDTLNGMYDRWKSDYVTAEGCSEGRRVLWDDKVHTVSEGIGYGMLLSVFFDDQPLLNDLWVYYQNHANVHGLMNWKIDDKGAVAGANAATDAEEDVAFALIMADKLWGSEKGKGNVNYIKEAKGLLYKMMDYEVEASSFILKPGDMWGGGATTNPSYFAPAYFRVYAEVSNDKRWLKVLDANYEVIEKSMNPETGLVPDWCNKDGGAAANVGWARENGNAYLYDACRTPWRIALDYLWFGEERAKNYCNTVAGFISKLTIFRVRDGYQLDGTRISGNHTSAFIGTFGVGVMAADAEFQDDVNMSYIENVRVYNKSYYNDCLRLLTLLAQTGNFFPPQFDLEK